jgi:hypothetical protein
MAVTVNQLEDVVQQSKFRQRIEFALEAIAQNIASEAAGTALHAQRKALSANIVNNPDQWVTPIAMLVVTQLSLSTTNMVGTTDIDTTDATLQTTISSVFNTFFP